jgi:hypothetical protein
MASMVAICVVLVGHQDGGFEAGQSVAAQSMTSDSSDVSPDARFSSLMEMYGRAESPAHAASLLYRIDELAGMIPVDTYNQALRQARSEVAYPTAKFALSKRLYRHALNRELSLSLDAPVEETLSKRQREYRRRANCLVDWNVVGPFDNDSMDGFDARLDPELGEAGPYDGKKREIQWRSFPPFVRGCHLFVGSAMRPSSSSVAYLTRTIDADSDGRRTLLVGADGAYRVWVNGELVAERTDDRGFAVDGQAWEVPLEKGENRILVKLGSTRTGSLALMARLLGPDLGDPDISRTYDSSADNGEPSLEAVSSKTTPTPVTEGDARGRVAHIRSCANNQSLPPERRIDCLVTWSAVEPAYSAEPW